MPYIEIRWCFYSRLASFPPRLRSHDYERITKGRAISRWLIKFTPCTLSQRLKAMKILISA